MSDSERRPEIDYFKAYREAAAERDRLAGELESATAVANALRRELERVREQIGIERYEHDQQIRRASDEYARSWGDLHDRLATTEAKLAAAQRVVEAAHEPFEVEVGTEIGFGPHDAEIATTGDFCRICECPIMKHGDGCAIAAYDAALTPSAKEEK